MSTAMVALGGVLFMKKWKYTRIQKAPLGISTLLFSRVLGTV